MDILKKRHEAITESWRYLKKYIENIPESNDDWEACARECREKVKELNHDDDFTIKIFLLMLEDIKRNADLR